ncbi:type IX secretion system periplasmic lipoprotein PorW/SprE [Geofilum sp. OHC36d9]|uniref:type IX secretion system periplasmic lipoprotein PorW/SprE n=1 Tax=Geofilum sp. OHC36d9 TaxID=3458413 RepID=UPI004033FA86
MRIKILIIFFALLGLGACSTQKNTWLSRNYNAMTARYNTLYNGTQSFKRGEQQLQQGRQDNYMAILPLFPYSGSAQEGMVTGDMERAIAKGLKAIQKKAIKVRPKKMPDRNDPRYEALVNKREFNPAIDDAYLLVGKAQLYNHNFVEAQSFLDFAFREFPGDWAQYEILLWQARIRMETGDWDNAKVLLDRYDAMGQAPLKYYGEYAATYAQWFIGMKQYNLAIPLLMDAAEMAPSRWDKIRRFYVLGQLYQITGQQDAAMVAFRQVIRLNPPYETALNAGIAHATAMAVATHDFAAARSELEKMVGQVKNEDFRDRLYFAIAETYMSEQDTANVVLNLKLAAGYNNGNENVLRETYLFLGDLFFSQQRYISSFGYYDSTLVMMPVDDERYKDVNFRHRGLKDLTTHLLVVQHEDSLLRLAALSPEQQVTFVEAIIERERLKRIEKELNMESSDFGSDQFFNNSTTGLSNNTANQSDGKWYFYNTTTASMGKMEFERKWGRRSLRDNWRRSDLGAAEPQVQTADVPEQREERDMAGMPEMPGMEEADSPGQSGGSALPDKKRLLDGIPSTPEQIGASKEKMAQALFQVGMIFYDYFEAYDEAGNSFNRFLDENKSHELTEEVLFWNYMACAKTKNEACMNQMRQQLTALYPEGKYAAYVNDPEFGDRQLALMKEMNETYKQAFEAYSNLDFTTTRLLTSKVAEEAEDLALVRKALLLRAMVEGKSGNSPGFERELMVLSTDYSETEEGLLAQRWLDMMREGRQPVKQTFNKETDDSSINANLSDDEATDDNLFKYEPQKLHFVWFMVEPMADINRLLFNVADYNFSRFLVSSYDISIDKIPSGQRAIVIGPFNNRGEAMDYYFALRSRTEVFKVDSARHILLLSGSENNRNTFMSSGDVAGYSRFFSSYYLEGGKGMNIDLTFVGTTVVAEDSIANTPLAAPISISPETAIIDEAVTDTEALQTSPPSSDTRYKSEGMGTLLVQVPQRTDLRRVAGFITGQAYNNFNIRVSVKQLTLSGGETFVLVEPFPNEEMLSKFADLLRGNTFWQSQLKAASWPMVPVNAFNLDVIKNEGSINNYLDWIEAR